VGKLMHQPEFALKCLAHVFRRASRIVMVQTLCDGMFKPGIKG
jgi:hypothetical protein